MQDDQNRTGVDLSKRNDLDGPPRPFDEVGTPVKTRTGGSGVKLMIAVMLLIALIAALVAISRTTSVKETPAAAQAPRIVRQDPRVVEEAEVETPAAVEEEVDYRETAREKICQSLAKEFLSTASPTQEQMRRTLTIYNVNECSNRYIRDEDAKSRGLSDKELEAVSTAEDIGPLRLEDK